MKYNEERAALAEVRTLVSDPEEKFGKKKSSLVLTLAPCAASKVPHRGADLGRALSQNLCSSRVD